MEPVFLAALLCLAAVDLPPPMCDGAQCRWQDQSRENKTCAIPAEKAEVRHPIAGIAAGAVRGSVCLVGKAVRGAKRIVAAPVRLIGKLKPGRRIGKGLGWLLLPRRRCCRCRF
jgi:hypothetical protein